MEKKISDENIWKDYSLSIYNLQFYWIKVLVSLPKSFHGPPDNENALQLACWPCYWSHFNSVKQADNTVDAQWDLTVYILPVNTWLWHQGPKELP